MIVYHGSSEIIRKPDILHSYRNLDFGRGFYITSVQEQAERWARRKAKLLNKRAVVTQYQLNNDMSGFVVKSFPDDLIEWIDFVCACRDGDLLYQEYDVIIGKVANDKVFRVVDMYKSGIWDKERAVKEIRVYPDCNWIAFISQLFLNYFSIISQYAIDKLLCYEGYFEV